MRILHELRRLLLMGFTLATALVWAAGPTAAGRAWWRHVEHLASDKLAGRNAGSPGHRLAAQYVAAQFKKAGLAPCGDAGSGYFQTVPLVNKQLVETESALTAVAASGQSRTLVLGGDAILSSRAEQPQESIEAQAVFLGYGLSMPGYDDFAGQDVRGKFVVTVSGSPSHLPAALRAHFSSAAERTKALQTAGAVGSFAIPNPANSDVPWQRSSAMRLQPAMAIDDQGLVENPGPLFAASLNAAKVAWLFEGAPHSLAQLIDLSTQGKPMPHFALKVNFRGRAKLEKSRLNSHNVCGVMIGAGAKAAESIVLSAHLDHLGFDPHAKGADKIYNGAMDNASGIATLIETARTIKAGGKRPARSIVFVAVTAEEKGLLGSRYFANRTPAAAGAIVANLNFDMFLPIHAMRKVMALGMEESTLRAPLEEVTARLGLGLQSDLEPQRTASQRLSGKQA